MPKRATLVSSKKIIESTPDVTLTINGVSHTVPTNLAAETNLVDYLRDHLHLTGTKFMCREGTCGSCVVNVKRLNPLSKKEQSISVNACLLPVYACAGLNVTTVEGIGDQKKGYHPVQERLADYNGTQCGFCSPGMVMTMYSLLENSELPPVQDVEDLFDGSICRCTGYRSILDAMKSFSRDSAEMQMKLKTMMTKSCFIKGMYGNFKNGCCSPANQLIQVQLKEAKWLRPMTLNELYDILKDLDDGKKVRLVAGNTTSGIYAEDGPYDIYIDTKGIQEFYQFNLTKTECVIGANATLTDLIDTFKQMETSSPGFKHLGRLAHHIQLVANTSVRNVASWTGNLMIKKLHQDFPSDIFVMLETVGTKITVGHYGGKKQTLSPIELMAFDMKGWVVLNLQLKTLTTNHFYNSYKIMPRHQSTQAYVNAAFLMEIDAKKNWTVLSKPSICYGGISAEFTHAVKTEAYLTGKKLGDPNVLKESLTILSGEINPDPERLIGKAEYSKQLAINLYYKYLLGVLPDALAPKIKSGADILHRPVSSGSQTFATNKEDWPVNQPIPKIEAKVQCSGEAEYIMDMPRPANTLYAAFVTSTVPNATLKDMDPSDALKVPGVVRFITAKDVPGENNLVPVFPGLFSEPEELLTSSRIQYIGQPVGLIVAESRSVAMEAAKLVKLSYENEKPPVMTMEEGIENLPAEPIPVDAQSQVRVGDAEAALKTSANVIKGEVRVGSQYHIYFETQVAFCVPKEDGMDVAVATQWMDLAHQSISKVLGIPKNSFNIQIRRLGGGYGGKVTRSNFVAAGCALAAHLTNKPVFLQLPLEQNLEMLGKRNPFLAKYEVGFDNDGKLEAIKVEYFLNAGCSVNETIVMEVTGFARNVYECPNWLLLPRTVLSNAPSNTWTRGPGSAKGIFVTEVIMENIAKFLKKDPLDIKALNLKPTVPKDGQILKSNIRDLYSQLRTDADIDKRLKDIQQFNESNRWKKKGLSIVPMEYGIHFEAFPFKYSAIVAIYTDGGSVAVSHGGIEMGQGINTKVAQVCARELGIPIDLVKVKSTNALINANGFPTGGSTTSEMNCKAVMECCKKLVNRMQPIREKLKDPTWKELVDACFFANVDLIARHMYGPEDKVKSYSVFGATSAEVEIDVLTGQHEIRRVDMLFDCGQSLSPLVDIGQIEGAFVMGLGLFLLEEIKYDPKTGKNLTSRLWEYFPPSTKDIPIDFRITLLKNAPNPFGILKSKASGEPPLCMSSVALLAIQSAIHAARAETGDLQWFPLDAPATVEAVHMACNVKTEQLTYK
uniref:Xanthine dehydrogenase n=1 Tax=Scolopendra viridis TaxID=118503 RepID=A0A4D5RAG3_SCOVI